MIRRFYRYLDPEDVQQEIALAELEGINPVRHLSKLVQREHRHRKRFAQIDVERSYRDPEPLDLERFSRAEREVAELLSMGESVVGVSRRLGISEWKVRVVISVIRSKYRG